MSLSSVEIIGFRSVRKIRFPLRRLTVLVGGNGVGKTNLYRSLELLQAAARGSLADEIARDGGLGSIFWAGGKNLSADGSFDERYRTDGYWRGEAHRLQLEASFEGVGDTEFSPTYRIELGFPPREASAAFALEAQIKAEAVTISARGKPVVLMERKANAVWARNGGGQRELVDDGLLASETALANLRSGRSELGILRDTLANWRFYHGFRTDADSPLRRPSHAITSPLLASNGSNLGAVFATLRHIRQETVDLDRAIADAFPGAELVVPPPGDNASFAMQFPEMPKRAFAAHELSDGTLQFLALMGALLSYRLPPFIALNEPEASLHPDLLAVLARIIVKAAERTQIWVVTHARELADAIAAESGVIAREVVRTDEGTWLEGLNHLGLFTDD
ncbi:AAA family ATPase [uncultured Devosia sp.]|uniref:AAA family ATPase n=1 Tax=uncultured Devosia sp. TaxID=211434 RepID=UPI0035C99C38